MIHYHGTPLTPRSELLKMKGKHFCVSFAEPRDADCCMQIGQSVMWDNGAFSVFTQGKEFDFHGYYGWLEARIGHPHWAVIPDVIGGAIEDQRCLVSAWPFRRELGAPVWHLGLDIAYLLEIADNWPRLCFGSSQEYWQVGSPAWERRVDAAFNELAKRHQQLPWIHMLRGLAQGGKRWPFASADSCNVARNFSSQSRCPSIMASEIDGVQCPITWANRAIQMEFTE